MKVVFVHMTLNTGGIETLILRMSNWLVSKDHEVVIVLKSGGDLISKLDSRVKTIILGRDFNKIFIKPLRKSVLEKYNSVMTGSNIMYSFGPESCYYSSIIYKFYFEQTRIDVNYFNCLYHPDEFSLFSPNIAVYLKKYYVNYIDNRSKLFMSEHVKQCNITNLGIKDTIDDQIIPLAVDDISYSLINRRPIKYNIVSIGRFVKFKTYNYYMPRIIRELLDSGYDVNWYVYGDGPQKCIIEDEILKLGLSNNVFLCGLLDYSKLAETLSGAYIFIGMGTSLIEAALCKVPSIPAIVGDDKAVAYGYFYELPYHNCGEIINKPDTISEVKELIKYILDIDDNGYIEECEKNYIYALEYSINSIMAKFLDVTQSETNVCKLLEFPEYIHIGYLLTRKYENLCAYIKSKIRHVNLLKQKQ